MNLYFIGRGIVLKGIVKYYGGGKNIPHTFGYTGISGVSGANPRRNANVCRGCTPIKGQL